MCELIQFKTLQTLNMATVKTYRRLHSLCMAIADSQPLIIDCGRFGTLILDFLSIFSIIFEPGCFETCQRKSFLHAE